MNARLITTEYTGLCPVQPWQHVAAVSQGSGAPAEAAAYTAPVTGAAVPRKAADRGASAVEWVVITGIVVAIVAGVGWGISKAISNKANDACNKIASAGNGDPAGANAGTAGGTGCEK